MRIGNNPPDETVFIFADDDGERIDSFSRGLIHYSVIHVDANEARIGFTINGEPDDRFTNISTNDLRDLSGNLIGNKQAVFDFIDPKIGFKKDGGGVAGLTVTEEDGDPTLLNINELIFDNGTIADAGPGKARISVEDLQYIELPYSNFINLQNANNLQVGEYYGINDFQTIHQIPGYNAIHFGPIELILVKAISNNQIAQDEVISLQYPNDDISWDPSDDIAEDGLTPRPGKITRRIDNSKQSGAENYDFRAVTFRRNLVLGIDHPLSVYNGGGNLFEVNVTKNVPLVIDRNLEYYVEIPNVPHAASPLIQVTNINTISGELVKPDGTSFAINELQAYLSTGLAYVYYSVPKQAFVIIDNTYYNGLLAGQYISPTDNPTWNSGNDLDMVVDPLDFQDYLTFGSADPDITGVILKSSNQDYNNTIWQNVSAQSSYMRIGENCNNNTFVSGLTYSMNIGDDFSTNVLIGDTRGNTFQNELQNYIIAGNGPMRTGGVLVNESASSNCTVFGQGPIFGLVFRFMFDTTARLTSTGGDNFAYFRVNGLYDSVIHQTDSRDVDIRGFVRNKYWEVGADWSCVHYFKGNDDVPKTFISTLQDTTINNNYGTHGIDQLSDLDEAENTSGIEGFTPSNSILSFKTIEVPDDSIMDLVLRAKGYDPSLTFIYNYERRYTFKRNGGFLSQINDIINGYNDFADPPAGTLNNLSQVSIAGFADPAFDIYHTIYYTYSIKKLS